MTAMCKEAEREVVSGYTSGRVPQHQKLGEQLCVMPNHIGEHTAAYMQSGMRLYPQGACRHTHEPVQACM
jgi:hypothetical protein